MHFIVPSIPQYYYAVGNQPNNLPEIPQNVIGKSNLIFAAKKVNSCTYIYLITY